MQYALLLFGLVLIIAGAHFLTEGASSIASRFGISPLVIGLTIVAFGTSAPELVVSITSAMQGAGGIAMGNVIGSNIINILLIGGLTAIIAPLSLSKRSLSIEIPACLGLSALLWLLASGFFSNGVASLDRLGGLVLIVFFAVFLGYNLLMARRDKKELSSKIPNLSDTKKPLPLWLSILYVAAGLVALIYGGKSFVQSASAIATSWGVSQTIIGLTIVALGTSLPELATSIVAALKGSDDLAIGNIIGSNIFNITCILGTASLVRPFDLTRTNAIAPLDYTMLLASAALLLLFGVFFGVRRIKRIEGLAMLAIFALYLGIRLAQAV